MKIKLLLALFAASLVFTGCAALQNGLNGFVNGLRGTGTNAVETVKSVL